MSSAIVQKRIADARASGTLKLSGLNLRQVTSAMVLAIVGNEGDSASSSSASSSKTFAAKRAAAAAASSATNAFSSSSADAWWLVSPIAHIDISQNELKALPIQLAEQCGAQLASLIAGDNLLGTFPPFLCRFSFFFCVTCR